MRLIINALTIASFFFASSSAIASCSGVDIAPNGNGAAWFLTLIKTSPSPSDSRKVMFSGTSDGDIINSNNVTGLMNDVVVNVDKYASGFGISSGCTFSITLTDNPNTRSAYENGFLKFVGIGKISSDKKSVMGSYTIYRVNNITTDTIEMGTMIGMKN